MDADLVYVSKYLTWIYVSKLNHYVISMYADCPYKATAGYMLSTVICRYCLLKITFTIIYFLLLTIVRMTILCKSPLYTNNYVCIPLSANPSCLQATLASLVDQNPSQMVPQISL